MPLRFATVGLVTAGIHYGVLALLVQAWGWNSTAASSLGFAIAVGFNYLMHYHWTFSTDAAPVPHGRALFRYACMIAGGFCINGLLMLLASEVWAWHYLLAQALALAAVVTWNYLLASRWVYVGEAG